MFALKVLHVIPSIAPRYGGPSQAVIELCLALNVAGIEAEIASTDADGMGHLPVSLQGPTDFMGVRTHFFSRDLGESLKYSASMANWLRRHVREFDLVHIHGIFSYAPIMASKVCRHAGVPYVIRPMGMLDPWSLQQKPIRKCIAWHLVLKSTLRHAAAIHCTCEEEGLHVERLVKHKMIAIIPNGIRAEFVDAPRSKCIRGSRDIPLSEPYILALSRIHPKKGIEFLMDAFASLVKTPAFANWKLVIAGDGENGYVDFLKEKAKANGIGANLHWTGWLFGEDKRSAMQEASIFVLFSHQENFGIAVVEAMACSVPVVVSDKIGLARAISAENTGWVSKLTKAAVCSVLLEACSDTSGRLIKGAAGRDLVRASFVWPKIAGQLIALYENLVTLESKTV